MYINQLQGVGFAGILATIRAKAAEKRLAPPSDSIRVEVWRNKC
jgi:hypothetical protein